ncbi:MAG: YybH family protein [Thermoanaerobaculia bacterium]
MFVHAAPYRLASWFVVGAMGVMAATAVPRSSSASTPSFRLAVEEHLRAVSSRDMEALLPTLTHGHELTMIAPDGHKFDTRQQYIDFHRQWFATQDEGEFEFEIVRLIESPELGHALIRYRYSSRDVGGEVRSTVSWLALTFTLEGDRWRLVFDQNTHIDAEP